MTVVWTIPYRVLILAICVTGTAMYFRWARADWLASKGTRQGLTEALRIEPENTDLVRRIVSFRNGWDDIDWVTDDELRRAAHANPLDSEIWIPLALREEARGDEGAAEADLVHAAQVDRQFIPTWVLANYYYQVDEPDKVWPLIERCLRLDSTYPSTPVFELAWTLSSDAARIQSLLPKQGRIPVEYLGYLISTDRADAAVGAWPAALAAGAGNPARTETLAAFPRYLVRKGRIAESMSVWNTLVDRKIIASGRLDPKAGDFLADPGFRFTENPGVFGWQMSSPAGVFTSALSNGTGFELQLNLDGNEPESGNLLSILAPVLEGGVYRIVVRIDPAGLKNPEDPGFTVRGEKPSGGVLADCPLLPHQGDAAVCPVTIPDGLDLLNIVVAYHRASGTVRASGTLNFLHVALESAR
jgi:hypothetical protein